MQAVENGRPFILSIGHVLNIELNCRLPIFTIAFKINVQISAEIVFHLHPILPKAPPQYSPPADAKKLITKAATRPFFTQQSIGSVAAVVSQIALNIAYIFQSV